MYRISLCLRLQSNLLQQSSNKLNFKQGIGIGLSVGIAPLFVTLAILWFRRPHPPSRLRHRKKDSQTQTRRGLLAFRYKTAGRVLEDGRG